MSKAYKGLLLILLLLLSKESFSQEQSFVWKLEILNEETRKHKEHFKNISRTGFQIDQIALDEGELILKFNYLPAIGKTLKRKKDKIVFSSELGKSLSLSRDEIREQLFRQFREKEKGKTNQRNFRKAIKGKRRTINSREDPYKLQFGKVDAVKRPFDLTFFTKDQSYANLAFDIISSSRIDDFPYIKYSNCSPFDRSSYFDNYFKRIHSGINPYPYRPREGVKKSRNFKLYFDRNNTEFKKEDLAKIVQVLTDTLYIIEKAKVAAWASVEGSLENNERLQEKRAEVLIKALEGYYGDSIPYSVNTTENWSLFYDQLQEKGIDSTFMNNEEWKALLLDQEEQEKWEPLLARQRKAELQLLLIVKLSNEQKHRLANIKFRKLALSYLNDFNEKKRPSILKSLLGIRQYLKSEVRKGRMEAQELCSLLPPEDVYEYHLVHFYEQAKKFDKGIPLFCDFEELALNSFHIVKRKSLSDPQNTKVYGDLLSIQSYIYQKIIEKKFSSSAACSVYFPDDAGFHHLYLNFLNFTNALKKDPTLSYDCDDKNEAEFDWAAINSDSRYYYILKQLVIKGNRVGGVQRSDWFLELDLYEFLWFNIYYWDPEKDYFFDKEVGVKEMMTQTRRLFKVLTRLCPHQAYGLSIDFYSKIVREAYQQQQKTEYLEEALSFIESFFLKHAGELKGEEAEQIVRFLIGANSYSLSNERGRVAMDLLERVERRQGLHSGQRDLYFALAAKMGVNPKVTR